MINQHVEHKLESSRDIVKKTIQESKPYYFTLEEKGSMIVTIFKPDECLGNRPYGGHNYRLLKCLVHEVNYKEISFNTNHVLQLSEKIAFRLLINKLEFLNLIEKDKVTLEIIKINNYHYLINIIDLSLINNKGLPVLDGSIDYRLKSVEFRLQSVDSRLQIVDSREKLYQDLDQDLYQDLDQDCTMFRPRLDQDCTKINKEEFIKD